MADIPSSSSLSVGNDSAPLVNSDTFITNHALGTAGAHTITVPVGDDLARARIGLFSADGDFWVRYGGTAAIPTANVTDGTGSERNPDKRSFGDISSFSMIAAPGNGAVRKVSIVWYR